MIKNKLLEIIKKREKTYIQHTEEAINMFLPALKTAFEHAFYDGKTVEMYVLDVSIIPQNFHFLKIEGQLITVNVGDKIETDSGEIEVDVENIFDFARNFSVIAPASMLEDNDHEQIKDYLLEVRDNNDKIPESILKNHKVKTSTSGREFEKVEKELDEVQRMALRYFKSPNIH